MGNGADIALRPLALDTLAYGDRNDWGGGIVKPCPHRSEMEHKNVSNWDIMVDVLLRAFVQQDRTYSAMPFRIEYARPQETVEMEKKGIFDATTAIADESSDFLTSSVRCRVPVQPRRVAISQSNYIPWRGYFDLIASVDEFIFYDDVQYTKNDWRNRNRVKTPQGVQWLTIPVGSDLRRRIYDVTIDDRKCGLKHWKTLSANYSRAKYFEEVAIWLRPVFTEPWSSLSELNQRLVAEICLFLGINTKLSDSRNYTAQGDRNGRLQALCAEVRADTYVSGPSAATYLDVEAFRARGIAVTWMTYDNYPTYPQLWGGFDPHVTILDALFNCGQASRRFMKFCAS